MIKNIAIIPGLVTSKWKKLMKQNPIFKTPRKSTPIIVETFLSLLDFIEFFIDF